MQALIHHHLRRRASLQPPLAASGHLDEDSLAAFTEGRLTKSESTPIITHLVDCAFCRRTTVRLIHLTAELGETEQVELSQTNAEPGRLKRLLERLAARVLPSSDEMAVFAYHARPEESEKPEHDAVEDNRQDDQTEK